MTKHISVPTSSLNLMKATLGIRYTQELLSTIDKWVECSGLDWTVTRLKSLNSAAKQLRAGNRSKVIDIYQQESISYDKKTLYPKHKVLKVIFNTIQTAQHPGPLKRHLGILRIGTMFRLKECSTLQIQKAITTISTPPSWNQELVDMLETLIEEEARKVFSKTRYEVKSPDLRRLKPFTATFSSKKVDTDVSHLPYGRAVTSLVSNAWLPDSLWDDLPDPVRDFLMLIRSGTADNGNAGRLAFLPERGLKCRTIAVPSAWTQLVFEPIHAYMDALISTTLESVVHDQNKGAFFLKDHLSLGKQVWCFDLSSATDLFPLPLQVSVLRGLNLGTYADALIECCSHWEYSQSGPTRSTGYTNYASGQPMGMYGSFPLFHLTHLLLLRVIERGASGHEGRVVKNSFKVLGDDVIITDQSVALRYREIIGALGVPISETKSITSDSLGEFAGFVGVKTNKSACVFRPYKHGSQGSSGGIVNLLDTLGSKARNLGPKWSRWYDLYKHTASWRNPDLSPLLPNQEKCGLLPDKIDRGTLMSLIFRITVEDTNFTKNLVYEFGALEDWNWPQVVSDFVDFVLGENDSSNLEVGIDYAKLDTESNVAKSGVFDDPLMREANKKALASRLDDDNDEMDNLIESLKRNTPNGPKSDPPDDDETSLTRSSAFQD